MNAIVDQRIEEGQEYLTRLEGRLYNFIEVQPRTKGEILEHLYGSQINRNILTNRFHNLMNRLRKKRPESITFQNGFYYHKNSKRIDPREAGGIRQGGFMSEKVVGEEVIQTQPYFNTLYR